MDEKSSQNGQQSYDSNDWYNHPPVDNDGAEESHADDAHAVRDHVDGGVEASVLPTADFTNIGLAVAFDTQAGITLIGVRKSVSFD